MKKLLFILFCLSYIIVNAQQDSVLNEKILETVREYPFNGKITYRELLDFGNSYPLSCDLVDYAKQTLFFRNKYMNDSAKYDICPILYYSNSDFIFLIYAISSDDLYSIEGGRYIAIYSNKNKEFVDKIMIIGIVWEGIWIYTEFNSLCDFTVKRYERIPNYNNFEYTPSKSYGNYYEDYYYVDDEGKIIHTGSKYFGIYSANEYGDDDGMFVKLIKKVE